VKIARDILLILFILLFVPMTQVLSGIPTPPDWNGIKTYFANSPMIAVIFAIPIIVLIFILLFIHRLDKWEDEKAIERHNELLEVIKNNKPIIAKRFSHGKRKYKSKQ